MKNIQLSDDLFLHKLQFMYDVEIQIEKSLPKMIKAATNEELKSGLATHLEETTVQRERLEKIFEMMEEKPKKVKSEGIRSIVLDSQNTLAIIENEGVADIAIAGSTRQVEHYEMALYLCAIADAELLGLTDIVKILEETLEEEAATDETLAMLAETLATNSEQAVP